MRKTDLAKKLVAFIDKSPSQYQAVDSMKKILEENGFRQMDFSKKTSLKPGDKGFVINNDSGIIAFRLGKKLSENTGFRIAGSHSDSPGFRIKSNPVIKTENIVKLNTEVYGGPILYSWFDRVLGIAGRVALKGKSPLKPEIRLIDFDKDMLTIPSVAIHMNRTVNKGFEINAQLHTLPVMMLDNEKELNKELLEDMIAKELKTDKSEILDFDLYLYDREKGKIIGANNEFISVGRQDNLAMAYTSMMALIENEPGENINVMVSTDNEEVGSRTIQGADSPFISNTLERILIGAGFDREQFIGIQENSFMISADMAHAVHPNFSDKADPTNRPKMGEGIVIKYAANKSYTSDAYSGAIVKGLCEKAGAKYQEFYNRSDASGGSTIGPITSTHLNIRACDVGGALLGMHSVRELGNVSDLNDFYSLFSALYTN